MTQIEATDTVNEDQEDQEVDLGCSPLETSPLRASMVNHVHPKLVQYTLW